MRTYVSTIYNPERDESVIKELHLKTLVTTYHASYSSAVGKKSLVIDPNDLEADQFMVYFNKYYKKRTQPVLRPVETGRRIMGYSRFSYFYTGKSEYEETISRDSYNYFRKDYELGKSRLYGKKQEALKKLKEDHKQSEKADESSGKKKKKEDEVKETAVEK
ncbi:hypothetical protein RUM44_012936 [Polyplax serrata]|uniref:Uncharacterized protein n=1 Tax=Polyplax serrata TaxID=468196 RepID=A0ABR1BD11_POLSC